jgi:hypothetical protein
MENVKYIKAEAIRKKQVNTVNDEFDDACDGVKTVVKYAYCWKVMKDVLIDLSNIEDSRRKANFILGLMKDVEINIDEHLKKC